MYTNNYWRKFPAPGNCKIASAKKINTVVFGSVSLTIRSNDIKLQ